MLKCLRHAANWIAVAAVLAAAIVARPMPTSADETQTPAKAGLADGWAKEVEVPAIVARNRVIQPASKLRLWVEQGWLMAKYETPNRGVEWEIVLAQATDPKEPQVRLEQPRGFEVEYGRYFIRENTGMLRVFRERKTKDSRPWPNVAFAKDATCRSWQTDPHRVQALVESGDWQWLGIALNEEGNRVEDALACRHEIRLRMRHIDELVTPLHVRSMGFVSNGIPAEHGLLTINLHQYHFHDEGDLLVVERSFETDESVRKKLETMLRGKKPPALATQQWFNAPVDFSFEQRRGNVILLCFFDTESYQPAVNVLHKKYKNRKFAVIGVCPRLAVNDLPRFIPKHEIEFPIGVDNDSQTTETNYFVKIWPTYVLIDSQGKVRQSYLENPPFKEIEELLNEAEADDKAK